MALPDSWIYQGERSEQLAEAGIDSAGIARVIRAVVDGTPAHEVSRAAVPAGAAAR
jgi:hypothetical protein